MADGQDRRFIIQSMRDASAQTIAAWLYPLPYDFYNAVPDDPDLADFLNPDFRRGRYFEVVDADGDLVGFFEFKHEQKPLEIGLGLRPDLTGRGLGLEFVRAGMEFARREFGATDLCLTVATFNQRAITVYERAGFREVERYLHRTNGADYPFVRMVSGREGSAS
jgi:ribosomal-protein-alanine N-acetyltransferase